MIYWQKFFAKPVSPVFVATIINGISVHNSCNRVRMLLSPFIITRAPFVSIVLIAFPRFSSLLILLLIIWFNFVLVWVMVSGKIHEIKTHWYIQIFAVVYLVVANVVFWDIWVLIKTKSPSVVVWFGWLNNTTKFIMVCIYCSTCRHSISKLIVAWPISKVYFIRCLVD